MSPELKEVLIAYVPVVTLLITTFLAIRQQQWKRQADKQAAAADEKADTLMAQGEQTLQEVKTNTQVSATGTAGVVKLVAEKTGEPEHKIASELADVKQRMEGVFNARLPRSAPNAGPQEPPGPAGAVKRR